MMDKLSDLLKIFGNSSEKEKINSLIVFLKNIGEYCNEDVSNLIEKINIRKNEFIICADEKYDELIEKLNEKKKNEPEIFEECIYWDYDDRINIDKVFEFLEESETYDEFYLNVYDYIYELNCNYIDESCKDKMGEILYSICDNWADILSDAGVYFFDLVYNYINFDCRVEELLAKSSLRVNYFPEQKYNFNSECTELNDAIEEMKNEFSTDNKLLKNLFASQGYKFEDLKEPNTPFLRSFTGEMNDYPQYYSVAFVILLEENLLDFVKNHYNHGKIRVLPNKYLNAGLFNPVLGSGSVLEVEFEKPFEFSVEDAEFQIEERKYNYGYTVNSTYGLVGSAWSIKFEYVKD